VSRTRACRRRSQSLAHTLTLCLAGAQDGTASVVNEYTCGCWWRSQDTASVRLLMHQAARGPQGSFQIQAWATGRCPRAKHPAWRRVFPRFIPGRADFLAGKHLVDDQVCAVHDAPRPCPCALTATPVLVACFSNAIQRLTMCVCSSLAGGDEAEQADKRGVRRDMRRAAR
jgi:hypothetical protein